MDNQPKRNPIFLFAKWLAKYLPANKTWSVLIICFFMMLIPFAICQTSQPNLLGLHIKIFGGFYLVVTTWMIIAEKKGKKAHKNALEGRKLRRLKELGFSIENIGDYWGYTG